jgi:hypothetical protein
VFGTFFKSSDKVFGKNPEKPLQKEYLDLTYKQFPTYVNRMMEVLTKVANNKLETHLAFREIIKLNVEAAKSFSIGRSDFTKTFYHKELFDILGIDVDESVKMIKKAIKENLNEGDTSNLNDAPKLNKFDALNTDGVPKYIGKMRKILNNPNIDKNQQLIDVLALAFEAVEEKNTPAFELRNSFTQKFYENIITLLVLKVEKPGLEQKTKADESPTHNPK